MVLAVEMPSGKDLASCFLMSDIDFIVWLSLKISGEATDKVGDRKTDEGPPQEGEQTTPQ